MKIFHLLSGRTWGGCEIYVLTLAKEQLKNGHSVEIICADRPPIVNQFRKEGFNVHVMQFHGRINLFAPHRLARMIRNADQPTVIHVHKLPDIVFAAKAISLLPDSAKKPGFITTHHIIEFPAIGKKFHKPYEMLDRIICV